MAKLISNGPCPGQRSIPGIDNKNCLEVIKYDGTCDPYMGTDERRGREERAERSDTYIQSRARYV